MGHDIAAETVRGSSYPSSPHPFLVLSLKARRLLKCNGREKKWLVCSGQRVWPAQEACVLKSAKVPASRVAGFSLSNRVLSPNRWGKKK